MMRPLLIAWLVMVTLGAPSLGQEPKPRQRIGLYGTASFGTISRETDDIGVRGDVFVLSCSAEAQEEITVGIYAYCRPAIREPGSDTWHGTGQWTEVPTSERPGSGKFLSRSLQTAGLSIRWSNASASKAQQTFQFFVPNWAMELEPGHYEVGYDVRAWANGRLVDHFSIDRLRLVSVSNTGAWQDLDYDCATPIGPKLCQFKLEGTSDLTEQAAH